MGTEIDAGCSARRSRPRGSCSTSHVARAIYARESADLGLLRSASGFSPALRKLEQEFERIRYDVQEERLRALFKAGKARRGLTLEEARRVL